MVVAVVVAVVVVMVVVVVCCVCVCVWLWVCGCRCVKLCVDVCVCAVVCVVVVVCRLTCGGSIPCKKRRPRRRSMSTRGQFKLLEAVAARRLLPHHGQVSVGCRDACPIRPTFVSRARRAHRTRRDDVHDHDVQTPVLARQDKSRQGSMLMSFPLIYRHALSPGQA